MAIGLLVAAFILALDGCGPSGSDEARLARSPRVAGQPLQASNQESAHQTSVLVAWGGQSIGLLGTWSPQEGWRNRAGREFPRLLPVGTTWALYGLDRAPVVSVSGPARFVPPGAEEGEDSLAHYAADLTEEVAPSGSDPVLAVSGSGPVDRAPVTVSPDSNDKEAWFIRQRAQRLGYWWPDRAVVQDISVDLDGDGISERIMTVDAGMTYGADLVVVAKGPELDVSILTEDAWVFLRSSGALLARVTAIADVNADGVQELGIAVNSFDFGGYQVVSWDGKAFRPVLWSWWDVLTEHD
jgi:hypothetical protein